MIQDQLEKIKKDHNDDINDSCENVHKLNNPSQLMLKSEKGSNYEDEYVNIRVS